MVTLSEHFLCSNIDYADSSWYLAWLSGSVLVSSPGGSLWELVITGVCFLEELQMQLWLFWLMAVSLQISYNCIIIVEFLLTSPGCILLMWAEKLMFMLDGSPHTDTGWHISQLHLTVLFSSQPEYRNIGLLLFGQEWWYHVCMLSHVDPLWPHGL